MHLNNHTEKLIANKLILQSGDLKYENDYLYTLHLTNNIKRDTRPILFKFMWEELTGSDDDGLWWRERPLVCGVILLSVTKKLDKEYKDGDFIDSPVC